MRYIITFILVLLAFTTHVAEAKSLALVIGLGEQMDSRWPKINGDKDVPIVVSYLQKAGYEQIHTLVNREATKQAIVDALHQLAQECATGDRIYIHFSGHGQLVTDADGDELEDEWDESWIPYDAYMAYDPQRYQGEKHLVDDEINRLLQPIRDRIGDSGRMLVVVDACHSNDSVRSSGVCVRGIRYEFVMPRSNRSKRTADPIRWLTLSACKDYEVNQELDNPRVGKLTYALHVLSGSRKVELSAIQSFYDQHPSDLTQTPCLIPDNIPYTISQFF